MVTYEILRGRTGNRGAKNVKKEIRKAFTWGQISERGRGCDGMMYVGQNERVGGNSQCDVEDTEEKGKSEAAGEKDR